MWAAAPVLAGIQAAGNRLKLGRSCVLHALLYVGAGAAPGYVCCYRGFGCGDGVAST